MPSPLSSTCTQEHALWLPSFDVIHDKFAVDAGLQIILAHIETVLSNVKEIN